MFLLLSNTSTDNRDSVEKHLDYVFLRGKHLRVAAYMQ